MEHRNESQPPVLANALGAPRPASSWERPAFEVISLDCEITSYAPDGDGPLF
jgi:hypothetical protein